MTSRTPSKFHIRQAVAFALAAAALAPVVHAQEALEEVTVTATRRTDTNLQTTPISVSAITAGDIERGVSKDLSQLASSIPGFSAAKVPAFNAASFAMRGVGITDIIVYQDSPVSVQVDDFVMPSVQTQLLDTFDMEHVEVLRGPQGTLFGKNTTGGAVNIRTKRPNMSETQGAVRLGYGSFNEVTAVGGLDLPIITDKLAIRLVGSYKKSDGYYKLGATYGPINTFNTNSSFGPTTGPGSVFTIPGFTGTSGAGTGERSGGDDIVNARAKIQWNVTDDLTVLAQYEIMRDKSDAVPAFNDTPVGAPYLWNFLGFTRPTGDPLDHMGSTNRQDLGLKMGDGQRINVDGAYINVDWKLSDAYSLHSVTGFRHQEEHLPNTYTGAAPLNTITGKVLSLFDASRDTVRDTFQQEVRLVSTLDGPLNYVAGAFFQRNDARFCVVQALGFVDLITNWGAADLPQTLLNDFSTQIGCNRSFSDSRAAFVDGTWEVNDKFSLGAGVRYTQDQKSWEGRTQVPYSSIDPTNPGLTPADVGSVIGAADFAKYPGGQVVNSKTPGFGNLDTTWKKPTWRLTGSYKVSDQLFSYLTVSRGYKAGGYNDQTGTSGLLVPELTRPVNPEYATNYELGFKFESENKRLRINPTFFMTKYSDVQRAVNILTVKSGSQFQETVFFNAAKVTAKGVELEVQALITDNFRIKAAGSWLDAKYDSFVINQPELTQGTGVDQVTILAFNGDFTGLSVPRSPKSSLSISGTYRMDLASGSKIELTGEGYYEARNLYYVSAAGRDYDAYLDSKVLFSTGATWTSADDKYFVRAYGKNLTDRRYRVASQTVATLWTHTQWGAPRNFGVQFGVNFGGK